MTERFLKKVYKTEYCWFWIAMTDRLGYGRFQVGRKLCHAHRISWELFCGKIPYGMHVLHECDCRNCVKPEHLKIGTHADNMSDKKIKGRAFGLLGNSCPTSILTYSQVKEIKKRLFLGESQTLLGYEFGVTNHTIHKIYKGINWAHV